MAKFDRKIEEVLQAQDDTEKEQATKFSEAAKLLPETKIIYVGRTSPQICCTVDPEDKAMLDELVKFASAKKGRPLKMSVVMRSIIRVAYKYKERMEF